MIEDKKIVELMEMVEKNGLTEKQREILSTTLEMLKKSTADDAIRFLESLISEENEDSEENE